mmetsp:Transcript_4384/g.12722  ORF Transcript_4384/g.12722 Transcript_4384/m.12722 type:complete len:246 (-) Transcript_4384:310-1047(-)
MHVDFCPQLPLRRERERRLVHRARSGLHRVHGDQLQPLRQRARGGVHLCDPRLHQLPGHELPPVRHPGVRALELPHPRLHQPHGDQLQPAGHRERRQLRRARRGLPGPHCRQLQLQGDDERGRHLHLRGLHRLHRLQLRPAGDGQRRLLRHPHVHGRGPGRGAVPGLLGDGAHPGELARGLRAVHHRALGRVEHALPRFHEHARGRRHRLRRRHRLQPPAHVQHVCAHHRARGHAPHHPQLLRGA